jgi:hypothetical protein
MHRPTKKIILTHCFTLMLVLYSMAAVSQERIITAGFQFKPIFTSDFFNTGPIENTDNGVNFSLNQKSGFAIGMVLRKGITKKISFETGINIAKRNFDIGVVAPDSGLSESVSFSITGYELPLKGMVFIQLSDYIYMDVAMGISLDFFPSDVSVETENFTSYSAKNSWVVPALLANIGWEYRTEKSGFIYLGASFHRPFETIYYNFILYPDDDVPTAKSNNEIQGNYLTIDVRYFFPSAPEKRKKKIKKNDRKQK